MAYVPGQQPYYIAELTGRYWWHAPATLRVFAFCLDVMYAWILTGVLAFAGMVAWSAVALVAERLMGEAVGDAVLTAGVPLVILLGVGGPLLYCFVLWATVGATGGQAQVGIRVIDVARPRETGLGAKRAAWRTLGYAACIVLGLWPFFLGWHDRIGGTDACTAAQAT